MPPTFDFRCKFLLNHLFNRRDAYIGWYHYRNKTFHKMPENQILGASVCMSGLGIWAIN